MVREGRKVPGLAMVVALTLVACGGEAESAPERDGGEPIVEEMGETPGSVVARHVVPAPPESEGESEVPGEGEVPSSADAPREEASAARATGAAPPSNGGEAEAGSRPTAGPAAGTRPVRSEPRPETVRRTDVEPLPPEPTPRPELRQPRIRQGTRLVTTLVTPLDTRTARPGDPFTARLAGDVLAPDGMVLVPEGARVFGRVVESRASEGPDDPAVLRLSPESVEVEGVQRPLRATLVEAEVEVGSRDSDAETAGKVAAGAAVGALLGQIVGRDTKSTVGGAAAGAAAGTAVAVASRGGHAVMGAGARLVFRVNETIVLGGR